MTQVAKNCTKSRATSRIVYSFPREERGQTSRVVALASVGLGLLNSFLPTYLPTYLKGCSCAYWEVWRGFDSWPSRTGGGKFLEGLCLGLLWEVDVVRLDKNMFCSCGLFFQECKAL